MSWNKDTYYYQNQIKVLSGTTPEPGLDRDNNVQEKIEANGLYKFVDLIKDKLLTLRDRINSSWRLHNEEKVINHGDDLDTKTEVGNYQFVSSLPAGQGVVQNRPDPRQEANNHYNFTLKVSSVGQEPHRVVWQDFIQLSSGRRWYRWGQRPNVYSSSWEWSKWMMILSSTQGPAKSGSVQNDQNYGTADEVFLKRSHDYTNGPIGFGRDPDSDIDNIKAKILLGKYSYGSELPSEHYGSGQFADADIPVGQIYLQYDENSSEGNN